MVNPIPGTPDPATRRTAPAREQLREAAALLRGAGCVLLDFNGTLSLDEDLLEHCYAAALRTLDLRPIAPGEYDALLGRSEHDIARALLEAREAGTDTAGPGRENPAAGHGPVTTTALLAEVARAYVEECSRRPRIPEAHLRLVRRLHEIGIPLAIATGTLREMVAPVLAQAGLGPLIPVVVTIEDVSRGKPDPEGFLRAAELLGTDITRAVVVEDSRSGVIAAHAAGATAIGVGAGRHGAAVAIADLGLLADLV